MKKIIKNVFFWCASMLPRKESRGAVVLMYHSISDSRAFFAVTATEFEKHMNYLKESGKECVSFSELMSRHKARKDLSNLVCITFDDGYKDNYEVALPLLTKYSLPATVFVTTGGIGGTRSTSRGDTLEMMDEKMIRTLSEGNLVEIMPHSHTHPKLSKLSKDEVRNDISSSKNALEKITGKSARYFAYPFGDYSDETIEILSSLGFKGAVTVKEGIADNTSRPYEIPRIAMSRETTFSEFKYKTPKSFFDSNKESYETPKAVDVYNHEKDKWAELQVYERYLKKPGRILDIGCGTGRTSSTLGKLGHHVIAVDYSQAMIDEARKRHGEEKIDFRVMDARALDFPDESFDYVFFSFNGIDYLHPEEKREMAFDEIYRVLKPGGIFAFSSHNAFFVPNTLSRAFVQFRSFVRGKIYPYRLEFHSFGKLSTHYISPRKQKLDLKKYGFNFLSIISKYGTDQSTITLKDPYPMYICSKP